MVLMTVSVSFVGFDILLFGSRTLVQVEIKMLVRSPWVLLNFLASVLCVSMFVADLIALFEFNSLLSANFSSTIKTQS